MNNLIKRNEKFMKLKDIGEFGFIERIKSEIKTGKSVIVGIGDDAAVVKYTRSKYLLVTTDMLIEDVHFKLSTATPYQIGHKAMACNISDIAAMGGIPKYAVVSIGLPGNMDLRFSDELYRGMNRTARRFGISIIGGDTNSSKKVVINVTLLGVVRKKELVLRSGAKFTDSIYVTGTLGGSIHGKHLNFIPRLKEAQYLVKNFNVHSMIDISDGLVQDLGHILKKSKAGAMLFKESIPISKEARTLYHALYDGEDFELLFIHPRRGEKKLKSAISRSKIDAVCIGVITREERGIVLLSKNAPTRQLMPKGWTHF